MLSGCIPKVETVTHLVSTSMYPEPSPVLGVAPASQNLSPKHTDADASPAHKQVARNPGLLVFASHLCIPAGYHLAWGGSLCHLNSPGEVG